MKHNAKLIKLIKTLRSFVSEENYFVIFPLRKLEFLLPKKHENYIINKKSGTDIVKIIEHVETYK